MIAQWLVHFTGYPEPVKQDPQLSRNGHNSLLFSAFATIFGQVQAPALQIRIRSSTADDEMGSFDQHRPQIGVAFLRDS